MQNNYMENMMSKTVLIRRGEYKCKVFKMHLKLRDQQLRAIIYIYRLLYQDLMVITNQKSITDIHTKKKKESKHNTKDIQITNEENKRRGKKRPKKKNPKQLTKWL